MSLRLGVNIDHVATIRNARGAVLSRARAGGRAGPGRRRRRHHRPPARRSPAHQRRRHRRADRPLPQARQAAELRDGGHRRDGRHRIWTRGRTPPAWCPSAARRSPPRAASTWSRVRTASPTPPRSLRAAGARVSLFIEPDPEQIRASSLAAGAQVIELHTGAYCDAARAGEAERAQAILQRLKAGAALASRPGPRGPRRSRHRLRHRQAGRRHPADRRAEHRPLPDRRGDLRGPAAKPFSACAP